MDNNFISSAWADFTYKMIREVECPVHRHKLESDWIAFSKKIKKVINEQS
jgi:hypothetical protein